MNVKCTSAGDGACTVLHSIEHISDLSLGGAKEPLQQAFMKQSGVS
jgi:hypothetical protein